MKDAYCQLGAVALFQESTNPEGTEVRFVLSAFASVITIDQTDAASGEVRVAPVPEQPKYWRQALLDTVVELFPTFNILYVMDQDGTVEKP